MASARIRHGRRSARPCIPSTQHIQCEISTSAAHVNGWGDPAEQELAVRPSKPEGIGTEEGTSGLRASGNHGEDAGADGRGGGEYLRLDRGWWCGCLSARALAEDEPARGRRAAAALGEGTDDGVGALVT